MLQSSEGYSDMTDFLLSELPAALDIVAYSSSGDALAVNSQGITLARITARSRLANPLITGFNFQMTGSADLNDITNIRMVNDTNGDAGMGAGDLALAGNLIETNSTEFSFVLSSPLPVPLNRNQDLWLMADLESSATGNTVGIKILNVTTDGSLAYSRNMNSLLQFVGSTPGIQIDGAFSDWANIPRNVDASNDVVSQKINATNINKNIDLADIRGHTDGGIYVFLSVGGTMLGGQDIPAYRTRPVPSTEPSGNVTVDSDGDGVPDMFDPMPFDTDNDGENNTNENGDWDSDGVAEYPRDGTDYWLNITIPSDFPANWANMSISLYVGPIGHVEVLGYDRAHVMIDSDNDPVTGTNLFGVQGIDYVAIVQGKNNKIVSSQMYEFNLSRGQEPWDLMGDIEAAIDWYRMELAIDPASIGIVEGDDFTIHASMEDWNRAYDVSDEPVELTAINVDDTGTRAPKPRKPRLNIVKSGPATAGPGDTITYTITITNPGKVAVAQDVVVTENYPADVTYVGASPTPDSGDNIWNLGSINPGESVTITITVTVALTVVDGDVLTNTAEVSFTDGAAWSDIKDDSVDTDIVIIPEMQSLALPIGGLMLFIITFRNSNIRFKRKKETK